MDHENACDDDNDDVRTLSSSDEHPLGASGKADAVEFVRHCMEIG